MSNYLTIAVITAAIQEIVQAAVQGVVPGAIVRVGPPQAVAPAEKVVNIYLYQVSPNAELRNDDRLAQGPDGSFIRTPAAAIRLHYLIAFGGEEQLAAEIMLGRVVSVLHTMPILNGEEIARIVREGGPHPELAQADLSRQEERIKLTPEYLTLEELSKLWSIFFQLTHRTSLQYVASPVLIDASADRVKIPAVRRVGTGITLDGDPPSREDTA